MKLFTTLLLGVVLLGTSSCIKENPDPSNGDFEYSRPAAVGMSEDNLLLLDKDIKAAKFGDIHSLIILKDGQVVFENYYNNHSRNELHAMDAATKSIVSALFGTLYTQTDSLGPPHKNHGLVPGIQ